MQKLQRRDREVHLVLSPKRLKRKDHFFTLLREQRTIQFKC